MIEGSELDETIKNILIRDLQNDGLTDFLKEQIKAYCLDGIKKIDAETEDALKALDEQTVN
jgi:hypothetical protein